MCVCVFVNCMCWVVHSKFRDLLLHQPRDHYCLDYVFGHAFLAAFGIQRAVPRQTSRAGLCVCCGTMRAAKLKLKSSTLETTKLSICIGSTRKDEGAKVQLLICAPNQISDELRRASGGCNRRNQTCLLTTSQKLVSPCSDDASGDTLKILKRVTTTTH